MSVKIYHSDYPERSVALTTPDHTLVFHHSASNAHGTTTTASSLSLDRGTARSRQQCAVEFAATENMNLQDYTPLSRRPCLGCLGLITIARDIFLCVITQAKEVARVRPEDTVYRILEVEFRSYSSFQGAFLAEPS